MENAKIEVKQEESITAKTKSYIVSTLQNTSLFIMMSFISKIMHLFFNVLIARIISKESYGLVTVYFIFIYMLILYFPRELLRKTCLKYCPDEREEKENEKFAVASQLTWLINFIVFFCSIPIIFLFLKFGGGGGESRSLSEYSVHLFLFIFSAFLELLVEPIVIYLNIKLDKSNRLIGMTIASYTKLISNYYFAYYYEMDLWSFTLSRILASLVFVFYMLYVALVQYELKLSVLIPSFEGMRNSYENKELKSILKTFVKGTTLKCILNHTEKIVLSFFLLISDGEKAEYTFISENFVTLIKYMIEPAEENFYNLINKIKNYKSLGVISSNGEDLTGDFSANENEILIKFCSNLKKKDKDIESYPYKLLKLCLKLIFIFSLMLVAYLLTVGREVIILIFTDKWGTDHAVSILKAYSIYVAIIAINGIVESYANAVCSEERMSLSNSLMTFNAILLVTLSVWFARYDTTGLIWANTIVLTIRFFMNIYLIIWSELESQGSNNCEIKNLNIINITCVKTTKVIQEMSQFLSKSFLKASSLISTLLTVLFMTLIKDLFHNDDSTQSMIVIVGMSCLVFSVNSIAILIIEKKAFLDVFRLKDKQKIKTLEV